MDRSTAFETIKGLLIEQLGVEEAQVTEAASFADDLNADSLDLVELIMEMEDRFKVQIPDEDAENIRTVGDAVDYVVAHAPAA